MSDLDYLLQSDFKKYLEERLGRDTWVTVHSFDSKQNSDLSFFCALVPNGKVEESLNYQSWDLSVGEGLPHCSYPHDGNEKVVEYHRFSSSGIEPLVIYRNFHGVKSGYIEISEEFRHFHNLYHDVKSNTFIKIDEDGNEDEIIQVNSEVVKIKLLAVKQFLAIKEMHLAVFFDSVRYSPLSINVVEPEERHTKTTKNSLTYAFDAAEDDFSSRGEFASISRVVGKKLFTGVRKEKSGFWPFSEEKNVQYVDFIIGVDEDGDEVTYTCNPERLANWFGANPEAPNYLTPVFFKREVLSKYYAHPEKYRVEDGSLRCGGLWLLRLDNNHEKYISVFLGDLGRDLSYNEQLYWRNFNISPESGISKVNFKRSFLAEAAEPEKADLLFKYCFNVFQERWEKAQGWLLFKPLSKDDAHSLNALRIPLNDGQAEFDAQILALTKVLVDSLNEKDVKKSLTGELSANAKGIDKLEQYLLEQNFAECERLVFFLRGLQSLRSTGVAHRKGSNYEKLAKSLDFDNKSLSKVFEDMLLEVVSLFNLLEEHFLSDTP